MLNEVLIVTVIIEVMTVVCRIKFGSKKERILQQRKKMRVHHSYIGVGVAGVSLLFINQIVLVIGLSLLFSDLLHHFVVLPLWVRRTEFP